jgi:microcystin-dependent protein
MSEPYLGEIKLFAFKFAPQGWALCNGATLPVAQNQALYSLLYTTYGGTVGTNFMLPDLQGHTPMGYGYGAANTIYIQGQYGGAETVTLVTAQMPTHTHSWQASTAVGAKGNPTGLLYAEPQTPAAVSPPAPINIYAAAPPVAPATLMAISPKTISAAGAGQAHDNMQPFLVLNYCIATSGYYPPRN